MTPTKVYRNSEAVARKSRRQDRVKQWQALCLEAALRQVLKHFLKKFHGGGVSALDQETIEDLYEWAARQGRLAEFNLTWERLEKEVVDYITLAREEE